MLVELYIRYLQTRFCKTLFVYPCLYYVVVVVVVKMCLMKTDVEVQRG